MNEDKKKGEERIKRREQYICFFLLFIERKLKKNAKM